MNEEQIQPFYICNPDGDHSSVYISADIGHPANYYGLYSFFRSRAPHQSIDLYLNCCGGWVTTALQIISSMMECPAQIIGHIEHECARSPPCAPRHELT